jgi:hypothetical protein
MGNTFDVHESQNNTDQKRTLNYTIDATTGGDKCMSSVNNLLLSLFVVTALEA